MLGRALGWFGLAPLAAIISIPAATSSATVFDGPDCHTGGTTIYTVPPSGAIDDLLDDVGNIFGDGVATEIESSTKTSSRCGFSTSPNAL